MGDSRKPNVKCEQCGYDFYKRPRQIRETKGSGHYCSTRCYSEYRININMRQCLECQGKFHPKKSNQKFCSSKCSALGRGRRSKKGEPVFSRADGRLNYLKEEFRFTSCMVVGCNYDRVYDVHRLIEGKMGGKYEIGNMFAICPNHHAEAHRGVVKFNKKSNCELIAVY